MRPQIDDVIVAEELARDRIGELKLLQFRQGGIDTPGQLFDRHRHFCAWCVRHARFITASARLPARFPKRRHLQEGALPDKSRRGRDPKRGEAMTAVMEVQQVRHALTVVRG